MNYQYVTPSHISLFVNGIHIDDATAIQWQSEDQRMPVYGYNDRRWRTIAEGRSLVQGQIAIHFRHNGYLTSVLKLHEQNRVEPNNIDDLRVLKHYRNSDPIRQLSQINQDDQSDAFTELALDSITNHYDRSYTSRAQGSDRSTQAKRVVDQLKGKFWDSENTDTTSVITGVDAEAGPKIPSALEVSELPKGFTLVLFYGDTDRDSVNDPGLVLLLEEVHLTGTGQTMMAEVPDGGSPVREVYPFIARSVRPLRSPQLF